MTVKKIAFLLLLLVTFVRAEVFLISELNLDSRSTALGHSDIGFSASQSSIYANPASLAGLDVTSASLTYAKGFEDLYLTNLVLIHPDKNGWGTAGLGVAYLNYGDFDDVENNSSYSAYDMMITLSYAKTVLSDLNVGGSLKYYQSKIDTYSSNGIGADISALYGVLDGKVRIGAGFYNVGFQMDKYIGTKEDLPTTFKIGASNKLDKVPLEFGAQYNHSFYGDSWYSVGAEFKPKPILKIRAGYDFSADDKEIGTGSKIEKFAGVSLGGSIKAGKFLFDFAYKVNGELDSEYTLTVTPSLHDLLGI